MSRKSRSAECINESDHPGKLFSLHFLSGQCEDTRVCHALKTMNEHSQEQCSPAATAPAGEGLPQVGPLITVIFFFLSEVIWEKNKDPYIARSWSRLIYSKRGACGKKVGN